MPDVLHWVDRHDGTQALEILDGRCATDEPATDLLAGIVATDPREQSGIWSTASGVLAAYRPRGALEATLVAHRSTSRRSAMVRTRCTSVRPGTSCQRQFAPLAAALLGDVRDATYERTCDERGGPPTLLALDEVANIAPLPDLPAIVSEGGGQGLLVLACLQDLSQA